MIAPGAVRKRFLWIPLLLGGGIVGWKIENDPDFGSWLADTGRAWVGPQPIAWAEDAFYGVKDQVERGLHGNDAPVVLWETTLDGPYRTPLERLQDTGDTAAPEVDMEFPPPDFIPPFPQVASPEDGTWQRYPVADSPMARTQVHPDLLRPYAAVAVVAIDLRQTQVRLVAGTYHPHSSLVPQKERTGKIPVDDLPGLVAVFNGGWQAVHGNLGMTVDKREYIPINPWGCTIVLYEDERIDVMSADRASKETGIRSLRQAVPCLYEQDRPHKDLDNEGSISWGYAISGGSIVTRSAIGVDAEGRYLFYGIGNALSGQTIATALHAAGAVSIALLDINTYFPRFYSVDPSSPWDAPTLEPLLPKMRPANRTYWDTGYNKDYFYVRKNMSISHEP